MYEEFYGLKAKPFQLNPDPTYYFASKQHRRAKAYLEYGLLRNEGFIVITGEIGAGKTTIVRGLLESLDADKVVAGNLVSTHLDAEDTLRMVGAAFGVHTKGISKADLLLALEAFLVTQASQGKRCLLIVDEAQNLTVKAVEELRMLSNFQYGNQALLQSFLVGQPEFREILQNPQMQQLRQRVIAACHIGPMDGDETQGYIEHRLKCAGSVDKPIFNTGTFEAVYDASGGIPRRINALCDRLLLLGFLENKITLNSEDVKEVSLEIQHEAGRAVSSIDESVSDPSNTHYAQSVNLTGLSSADLNISQALLKTIQNQMIDGSATGIATGLHALELRLQNLELRTHEVLMALREFTAAVNRNSGKISE
ncbi:XrtA/PEP-CTERM system-associated ATPase [Variovorax sp. HJSM1_2]|uniref:XrtA/PEP-CTERM system-associated ATPase n=1 Tax=Variovorax sp. HJSM1_2 TaxID=3366263 RepID=UPI003BEC6E8E